MLSAILRASDTLRRYRYSVRNAGAFSSWERTSLLAARDAEC